VASRNGDRGYCDKDAGKPFGSSSDNNDRARNNLIVDNLFRKLPAEAMVQLDESPNYSFGNLNE